MEDLAPAVACSTQVTAASAADALVWIRVDLGNEGYRYCSAVAIAPRLVLTVYSCVAYPGDLEPEGTANTEDSRFPVDRQTYFDPAEYETFCERSTAWSVIEDGSFRSRLSVAAPPADVGVGRSGDIDRPTLSVDELIPAGSSSRCNDGVALLLLSAEQDTVPVPLRLEDFAQVGEPVLRSGIVADRGRFVRSDAPAIVQRFTAERGDEAAPPQSLLLAGGSCYLSRGGPVFAQASGALIALVTSGQNGSCDDVESGSTLAVRLAPYRALLLGAASSFGQILYSEARRDTEPAQCPPDP
jgi:hypothetical protein